MQFLLCILNHRRLVLQKLIEFSMIHTVCAAISAVFVARFKIRNTFNRLSLTPILLVLSNAKIKRLKNN